MDAIMKIVEGETTSEFDFNSIDHDKLKSFQAKCTVWDFNDITKEEYMNKLPSEKQDLIISYYKHMVKGMLFLFVVWNAETKILGLDFMKLCCFDLTSHLLNVA